MSKRNKQQQSSSTGRPGVPIPDVKQALGQIKGSVAQPFALPRQPRSDQEAQRLYFHIRTLCFWLDAASSMIQIPYLDQLPFTFGIEAIIGAAIPVFGDVLGFFISLYVILLCMQFGLPAQALLKMLSNAVIDVLVGVIPIIGDLVDLAFKSNLRNLGILEDHLLSNPPPKPVTANGLTAPSTHFAIRIPPSGPFWPKSSAPETSFFYESPQPKSSGGSFFSNIFGSPTGLGSHDVHGWKLGGANRADIEQVGGWTGESARVLWQWILAILARVAGKTQQASRNAKPKKAY